jgi:outer membrane protein assembly factor BamB
MLHVIDVATGKETASVDLGGQVAATAGVLGESLYVGTMTNQVLAVNWKKPEVVWTFEPNRARAVYASAAVTDILIVTGNRNNKVYAIGRKTGAEAWSFTTRGAVDSLPWWWAPRVRRLMDDNLSVLDLEKGTQIANTNLGDDVTGLPAVGGAAW